MGKAGLQKAGFLGLTGKKPQAEGNSFEMGVRTGNVWRNARFPELTTSMVGHGDVDTLGKLFANAANKFGPLPCMGWRDITDVEVCSCYSTFLFQPFLCT